MTETTFIRTAKTKDYTVLNNNFLKNNELSMQAKGLFSYILSLPEDWVIYKSELITHFSNGKDAVFSAIKELESFGYLKKEKAKSEKGRFAGYKYTVIENPSDFANSIQNETNQNIKNNVNENDRCGLTVADKPLRINRCGQTAAENPQLLNTNRQSTNKLNTNKLNTNKLNLTSPFPLEAENPFPLTEEEQKELEKANKKSKRKSSVNNKLNDKPTFSKSDYVECVKLINSCKDTLRNRNIKIDETEYPYSVYQRWLKQCFVNYGVENTKKGITNSISDTWLVNNTQYSLTALFSDKIFPRLINLNTKLTTPLYQNEKHHQIDYIKNAENMSKQEF